MTVNRKDTMVRRDDANKSRGDEKWAENGIFGKEEIREMACKIIQRHINKNALYKELHLKGIRR